MQVYTTDKDIKNEYDTPIVLQNKRMMFVMI